MAVDGAGNLFIAELYNARIRRVDTRGIITTVAGNGERGYSGDGGPADQAQLNGPSGVAVNRAGNLYIADSQNNRIRRVDTRGIITTFAGTGASFSSRGDGGPATRADLWTPRGLAFDNAGNLYIAASDNRSIRRVDTRGIITTIAGTGEHGYSGDNGPAVQARLTWTHDVAVDGAGNVYIADSSNARIRRVDTNGIITTVAGTGEHGYSRDNGSAVQAQLRSPEGVAVDRAGNLFIADTNNNRIRQVDARGITTTTVGGGIGGDNDPAVQAQLKSPTGVAVDGAGNLFIADNENHRIRRLDARGIITTIAGTGALGFSGDHVPAVAARLSIPIGLTVDDVGNLFIADTYNNRIRRVDARGIITTVAGTGKFGYSGDNGPAVEARISRPYGVAVDNAGNVYVADQGNSRVRRVDARGIITTVAGNGEWGYSGDNGPAVQAQLKSPTGVAVDGAGNLFIATGSRIRKVDVANGTITTIAGTGVRGYGGDNGPAVQAQLDFPSGVAVDRTGNLFIADTGSHSIRRVDAATGTITTIAGTGEKGYSGDGGPAVQAQLSRPFDLAVDGAGNLFIADTANHRIRVLRQTSPPITLSPPIGLTATAVSSSRIDLALAGQQHQ